MILNIKFPQNLITDSLVGQERIPCLCKVSDKFEILFQSPILVAEGIVTGWDRKKLEERALAGAGGAYTHCASGLITLKKIEPDKFNIYELSLFYADFGWCPVIAEGDYAVPKKFWNEDFF